jgi:membrane protein
MVFKGWSLMVRWMNWIVGVVRATSRVLAESDARILVGSLAYATVVSLVPLLAVSLSAFHAYGGFGPLLKTVEPLLLDNLVPGTGGEVRRTLHGMIQHIRPRTLGIGGVIGLLVSSMKLFFDIETAVQRIWGIREKRAWPLRLFIYVLMIFLGPLLLAVAVGVISSYGLGLIAHLPKGTISFLVTLLPLAAIYKILPARKVSWRDSLWSALLAAMAIVGAEQIHLVLTKKILKYNKLYGSLASIPIFFLWIWTLWWICLAGAALCRQLHERRALRS